MTDTTEIDESNEVVGYGKPPKKSQFKKGQSGNPGGRPKGSKSTDDLIIENLEQEISIRINGQVTRTTVKDGILKAQTKWALDGDIKSAKFLFNLLHAAEERKYYMEFAADYFNKQIYRGLKKQPLNEREAQRIFNETYVFSVNALDRYNKEKLAKTLSSSDDKDPE